jgi:hypothetical protein
MNSIENKYDLPDRGIHVQMEVDDYTNEDNPVSSEMDGYDQVFDKRIGLQPIHLERKTETK